MHFQDVHLREIDRLEDPMLEYIRKKKEKRVQASGSGLPRKFSFKKLFRNIYIQCVIKSYHLSKKFNKKFYLTVPTPRLWYLFIQFFDYSLD